MYYIIKVKYYIRFKIEMGVISILCFLSKNVNKIKGATAKSLIGRAIAPSNRHSAL